MKYTLMIIISVIVNGEKQWVDTVELEPFTKSQCDMMTKEALKRLVNERPERIVEFDCRPND